MANTLSKSIEKISNRKRKLYTTLLWGYLFLVYLIFCNTVRYGMLFAFAFTLFFAVIAISYPQLIKSLLFPKSFKDWVMGWKIVFACKGPKRVNDTEKKLTWKQQIHCVLLVSNIFPIIILTSLFSEFYTPILDLEELDTHEGTIKRVIDRSNRGSPSKIWLRTAGGKIIKFYRVGDSADVKYLKQIDDKETIKVWSQRTWGISPGHGRRIVKQVQHNDILIKKYDKNIAIQIAPKIKTIFYVVLTYFIITMTYLWIKGHKYKKTREYNL